MINRPCCYILASDMGGIQELQRADPPLNEIHRVLKLGGRGVIIDLRRDVSEGAIREYVRGLGLNPVNAFLTRAIFKSTLIKCAYTVVEMREMVGRTPFDQCEIKEDGFGFEAWLEKSE